MGLTPFPPGRTQPSPRSAGGGLRLWVPVIFLGFLGIFTGCAGVGELPGLPRVRAADSDPWRIPETAMPTQRLYRVEYQGPEGKASFRLTLYLQAPQVYRMEASDSLGRRVWSLEVDPEGKALWLDHRREVLCRAFGAGEQSFVPLAHLPLASLPRLVLGLLPTDPEEDLRRADDGRLSYLDGLGRRWSGGSEGGRLAWWSLAEGDEAVAWWKRTGDENVFSDRRGGQQVRWREQVAEPMTGSLEALEVPKDYREGSCGAQLAPSADPRPSP
ncbi:MAG: hypothetical protein AAGN66_24375 [Acidobacteriota bacterium]